MSTFRIISIVIIHALILNDLSFAASEIARHLSPPSGFDPIVTVVNGIRTEIKININPETDPEFAGAKMIFQARVRKNGIYSRIVSSADIDEVMGEVVKNSYDSFIDKFERLRATGAKSFTGTITLEAYYDGDDLVINVIDNGLAVTLLENGMPSRRIRPKGHPRTKKHFGGGGVGLTVSKGLLETLGGTIQWHPLEDGTRTEIRIPKDRIPGLRLEKDEYIAVKARDENALMEKAAFRQMSILIGKYLLLGISEHTVKAQIKNRIAGLLPGGFAIDELEYNASGREFRLPFYRNGRKALVYTYRVGDSPGEAGMRIPAEEGKYLHITIEAADKNAALPKKTPPAGSIAYIFDFLCRQDSPLAGSEIAEGVGRSYETIKYDLRALGYHLRLVDTAGSDGRGRDAAYYVPARVKEQAGAIRPILGLFLKDNLRPTKALLKLVYELFIRPIFIPDDLMKKDASSFNRIRQKFEAYFAELADYLASPEGKAWAADPKPFLSRIASYHAIMQEINNRLIVDFNKYCAPGTPFTEKYIEFNNMVVHLRNDLRAIQFKAERYLQNGEFDVLFRPIRGKEEEFRGLTRNDETGARYDELTELFKAVVERLETHILVEIENRIDKEYKFHGRVDLKSKLSALRDKLDTIRDNLPNIDIEAILALQFALARQAEALLLEIKNGIAQTDMDMLVTALITDHETGLPEPLAEEPTRRAERNAPAAITPNDKLKNFMCTIEENVPSEQPEKGSPEERLLEFSLPQLKVMLNMQNLGWTGLEQLTRLANRKWERLGSKLRVWADDKSGIMRVHYLRPSRGWGKIPALAHLLEKIGSRYSISEKNRERIQVFAEQALFWFINLRLLSPLGSFWATAITWSAFFALHFIRTKNMPQAPPWYKIMAIAAINAAAFFLPAVFGMHQLVITFILATSAHVTANIAWDEQAGPAHHPLRRTFSTKARGLSTEPIATGEKAAEAMKTHGFGKLRDNGKTVEFERDGMPKANDPDPKNQLGGTLEGVRMAKEFLAAYDGSLSPAPQQSGTAAAIRIPKRHLPAEAKPAPAAVPARGNNDRPFRCQHCNARVLPLETGHRDHCPECLWSVHLDNEPGDRASQCHGLMEPVGVEQGTKKGWSVIYRCLECGHTKKNKAAPDDTMDAIIALSEPAARGSASGKNFDEYTSWGDGPDTADTLGAGTAPESGTTRLETTPEPPASEHAAAKKNAFSESAPGPVASGTPESALLNGDLIDIAKALNTLSADYYEKARTRPLAYLPAAYADLFMEIRDRIGFDGKEMLEVEPAYGLFMYALERFAERARLRLTVTGLELNTAQAKYARKTGGLDVRTGNIEDASETLRGRQYDCVFVRWPYFEITGAHDVKQYLAGCYTMTKAGGLCVIDTNISYDNPIYCGYIAGVCRDAGFAVETKKDFIGGLLLVMRKPSENPAAAKTTGTVSAETESARAIELTDTVKLIRNTADPAETITVGLGTSWMAAYNSDKPQRHEDLNKLITATGRLLRQYKINYVAQRAGESDADFAKRIDVANDGKVIVLTGLDTIVSDDSPFKDFRDRQNVFLAGVDTKAAGLDENCYLPIVEMLKLALQIGLKDILNQDAASDNITTEPYRKFKNVFRFLPKALRIPIYENLRALYRVQEFA